MQGIITADREALLTVLVQHVNGQETPIESVVDTGFTEFLTLPMSVIQGLSLPFTGTTVVTLADGSQSQLAIFRALVSWHGQPRRIEVLAADGGPLLGMSLLYGSRLTMDILDGSVFTVEPLP